MQGLGRANETWTLMQVLHSFGEATWFQLGDGDTALHVIRTHRLRSGATLSEVVRDFQHRLCISACILPMTDSAVATRVLTEHGELAFQEYFVKERCQPRVCAIRFAGATDGTLGPGIRQAFESEALEAIILCPSNPYLSLDPLLSIAGMRAACNSDACRQLP